MSFYKNNAVCLVVCLSLCACTYQLTSSRHKAEKSNAVQTGNPASVYCEKIGGQVNIQKDKDGNEFGLCKLPDGKLVDEWQLYRDAHPADLSL